MRNAWYIVKRSDELSTDAPCKGKLLGIPLVLFRDQRGQPACFLDACPHRSVPLSLGKIHEGKLECAFHAWRYDCSGQCVEIPALPAGQQIPKNARAHALPAIERGGVIWVWPGDPKLADASSIPLPADLPPGVLHAHTMTALFPVRYNLLMEHVLDIPHFHNLHASTILKLIRHRQADVPIPHDVEDRGDELTMTVSARPGAEPSRFRIFNPCHLSIDISLPGGGSYRFLFITTPVDEGQTMGIMFQYRSFLNAPLVKDGFNWIFARVVRRAIAEDGTLFKGQMENIARGAKSHTSYYFDGILTKYDKWQRRREPSDLWFRDFAHERMRYEPRPAGVRLPVVQSVS